LKTSDLEALVAPLRADVTSGAATLARAAAAVVERVALDARSASASRLVEELTSLTLALLDAQPAMAPLVALARDVLLSLDVQQPPEAVRERAISAARAFQESLSACAANTARVAAQHLPHGAVLTLSFSSTVRDALREAACARAVHVFCLESRPLREGETLARELAEAGLSVTLAVDAAAESLLPACGAVLLGADSIGDLGVVNKIGSAGLARSAAHHGVPLLVAADASKRLPPGFPQLLGEDRPASDVSTNIGGLRVWNRYFEAFPGDLVTTFLGEEGPLQPMDLERRRRGLAVPPALAQWAELRRDPRRSTPRSVPLQRPPA
jgi:translation initiation factor 2B subunit (eIF-2B alpha/beta/delta family)